MKLVFLNPMRGRRIEHARRASLAHASGYDVPRGHCRVTLLTLIVVFAFLRTGPMAYAADPTVGDPIDYNQHIRPILSDKCFFCHGPDKKHREADLRLDTREGLFADLGGYAPVVPGAPDDSEVVARIVSRDEDEKMPPHDSGKKLTAKEIDIIRRWIQQGAAWQQHWAYVPPTRHPLPTVKNQDWPLHWIDRFVLGRLEAERLAPAAEADRVTLIRRLNFDLIGLPPTPDEVKQFVDDRRADAYERLVDRLLASPHFGERMAMYWLDLVRYADTVGYHGDQDHNISPYRDYVIDAFNDNMPFDQFTTEQLAGDLLPDATVDQKVASGYNRLLQTSHEGGVQPKEYLAIYAADRVRNVSGVWMGATLGCAQCHDHKYDPFTTKDFYAMSAFFADIDESQHFKRGTNSLPTKRPPEIQVLSKRDRMRIVELEAQIAELQSKMGKLASDRSVEAKQLQQQIKELSQQREVLNKNVRTSMITVSIKPRTIRVLPRGNWLDDSGPVVEPQVPEFLLPVSQDGRRATRLDLAHWLDRNGDRQSAGRGEESHLDATRHERRIDVTRRLDGGEGYDHAGHRAQEAHQRRHVRDRRQDDQAPLQKRELDRSRGADGLLELPLVQLTTPNPSKAREEDRSRRSHGLGGQLGGAVDVSRQRHLLDALDHASRALVGGPQGPRLGDDHAERDERAKDERVHHQCRRPRRASATLYCEPKRTSLLVARHSRPRSRS